MLAITISRNGSNDDDGNYQFPFKSNYNYNSDDDNNNNAPWGAAKISKCFGHSLCVGYVLHLPFVRSVRLTLPSSTRRFAPHFSSWPQQLGPNRQSFIRVSLVAFGYARFRH